MGNEAFYEDCLNKSEATKTEVERTKKNPANVPMARAEGVVFGLSV